MSYSVTVKLSRYRITYTPTGESVATVLLAVDDYVDAQPSFNPKSTVQVDSGIAAEWVSHHARGNASIELTWQSYFDADTLAEAQATALALSLMLHTKPEGTLRIQTAYDEDGEPTFDQSFHATLTTAKPDELELSSSPFESAGGMRMQYAFTVSNPSDNNT